MICHRIWLETNWFLTIRTQQCLHEKLCKAPAAQVLTAPLREQAKGSVHLLFV